MRERNIARGDLFFCLQSNSLSMQCCCFFFSYIISPIVIRHISWGNTLAWLTTQYWAWHIHWQHNAFAFYTAATMKMLRRRTTTTKLGQQKKAILEDGSWVGMARVVWDNLPFGRKALASPTIVYMCVMLTPQDLPRALISINATSLHSAIISRQGLKCLMFPLPWA